MSEPKPVKSYRLSDRTVKLIDVLTLEFKCRAQADVIEMWAKEWEKVHGVPKGMGQVSGAEKKSGAGDDDLPDELLGPEEKRAARPVKVRAALPAVIKGSQLPVPQKKVGAGPVLDIENGRITNQATNLAGQRAGRAPLKRPGEK